MIDPMSEAENVSASPHPLLARAAWLNAPQTRRVFDVLEGAGFKVRAVGGTVRNTLLGQPVIDVDLATDAPPEATMQAATQAGLKVVPTGLDHGTVTIIASGQPFEVTTLRKDVATDGRHATVAFTSDWTADAQRRDFTINAIYCDRHGVLFDPVGGLADIAKLRVRFIGDARARIREDYLRILRFFRFSAQYTNGELDATGLAACIAESAGLQRLSAERIHHELLRLLSAPAATAVAQRMAETGFFPPLIGSDADVGALTVLVAHENAVASHGQKSAAAPDPLLRLAALTARNKDDVERLRTRLRLSNAETSRLNHAVAAASEITPDLDDARLRALIYRHGNSAISDGIALVRARSSKRDAVRAFGRMVEVASTWAPPVLPFSGADVVAHGVAPGPTVAQVLKSFEQWWIDDGFPDDRHLLEQKLAELAVVTKP